MVMNANVSSSTAGDGGAVVVGRGSAKKGANIDLDLMEVGNELK